MKKASALHFFILAASKLVVSIDALGAEAPRRISGLRYEMLAPSPGGEALLPQD